MGRMEVIIIALMAAFFFGLSPILEKTGLKEVDPLTGLFIRSAVVFSIILIAFIALGKTGEIQNIDTTTILYLGAGGISAGLVGHLLYYYALKEGEASEVVPVTSIYPLIALVLAVVFLGEKVGLQKLAGAILIVLGVILIK